MGSYYVMELSRSEGYELSVNGISLKESNRTQDIVNRSMRPGRPVYQEVCPIIIPWMQTVPGMIL